MSQRIRGRGGHHIFLIGTKTQTWERTLKSCFLSSVVEFRSAVSEEKSKMSRSIRDQSGHLVSPIGLKNTNFVEDVEIPYQSEKFAASLPQTCRKLAAHYLVRQRNLETVCRSVPLVAHFRRTTDCAPQRARLCARTGIVCEKCATIYS